MLWNWRHLVNKNDLAQAEKQLQQGFSRSRDDLKSVINLRLARVQLQ
ncbi:tetratricopeptide repeat protein [Escherichia coli]